MKLKERIKIEKQTMSPRDTILIFILGIVAVLVLGFNYLIMPKYKTMKSNYEIASNLSKEYKDLKSQNDNIQQLKKRYEEIKYNKDRMELQIPAFNSQAHSVLSLENEAKVCNLKIGSMSFEDTSLVSKEQFLAENPQQDSNNGETAQISGNAVVNSIMNVGFQGNYTEVYKFLKRLEENDRKYYIKGLSLNVGESSALMGNMKLQIISYIDVNNETNPNINIPQYNGKFDMFSSTNGAETINKDKSYYSPDIVLRLNPFNYEGPKVIFSEYGRFDKELYDNSLKNIKGTLSIEKKDANCTIKYTLGNKSKTVQKKINSKDGTIKLDVLSTPRISIDDVMGVSLAVDNKTPFSLEINVVNDDLDRPKFNLSTQADNIHVTRVTR